MCVCVTVTCHQQPRLLTCGVSSECLGTRLLVPGHSLETPQVRRRGPGAGLLVASDCGVCLCQCVQMWILSRLPTAGYQGTPFRDIFLYTGVYWFHIVRLSVWGRNRVRSVSSTILTGPISYLHILSSNFRRCVVRNVCFKLKTNEVLANSLKFVTLSCFDWDPIWINSMGNQGAAWVCWKRRRAIRFRLINDVLYTC